jgi:hypothetical protein
VLKSERATEVVDRQAFVQRSEEVEEDKQEEDGGEQFSGLEELELDAEGALGEADADAIAEMEAIEGLEVGSRRTELEEAGVREGTGGGRVLDATR